jgi:hypothetical protein
MPTVVTLPACLMDCYKVLYPNLDFSRVAFYSGLPTGFSGSSDGFTMASGAAIPDIRVYIENYKPCTKDTFLTIAHELVHVVQIQGMLGGGRIPGSWAACGGGVAADVGPEFTETLGVIGVVDEVAILPGVDVHRPAGLLHGQDGNHPLALVESDKLLRATHFRRVGART